MVFFSPFTFIFLFFYFFIMGFTFCISNFFLFWVAMEALSFLYFSVAFSFISSGFTSLMLYFIVQALASLGLLTMYALNIYSFFYVFFLLNLALFPFCFWFYSVFSLLSNLLFFLGSTFQNIPPLLIISYFLPVFNFDYLSISLIFTVFYAGVFILFCSDFRHLLLFSSIGNNSWFVLSCSLSLESFLLFFSFYCFFFLLILVFINGLSLARWLTLSRLEFCFLFLLVLSLAGIPPFPLFFFNLYFIYISTYSIFFSPLCLLSFLFGVVLMLVSYLRFLFTACVSCTGLSLHLLF